MSDKNDEVDVSARPTASRLAIGDIARRSGVSVTTVSRVLNDHPDVSKKTRDKVMRQVRELGYMPNRHAQTLASQSVSYIGFSVPYMRAPYFGRILEGASEALVEHNADLVVYPTPFERGFSSSLLQRLLRGAPGGALFVLPSLSPAEFTLLHQRNYPFVVIDPLQRLADDIPVVTAANISGAITATEHLVALGAGVRSDDCEPGIEPAQFYVGRAARAPGRISDGT